MLDPRFEEKVNQKPRVRPNGIDFDNPLEYFNASGFDRLDYADFRQFPDFPDLY